MHQCSQGPEEDVTNKGQSQTLSTSLEEPADYYLILQLNFENLNFAFSKYSLIQNKFGTH